jgi:hypothetical protein
MLKTLPFALLVAASTAWAAPEDRGPRGLLLSGGIGLITGTVTDESGRDAGGFLGQASVIRIGEEALPGLTLGLEILIGDANANADKYSTSLSGLLVQLTYRPFVDAANVVFIVGTGIGGGRLQASGGEDFSGAVVGGLHELGVAYEVSLYGDASSGLVAALTARWVGVPPSGEAPTTIQTYLFGIEAIWYAGRD